MIYYSWISFDGNDISPNSALRTGMTSALIFLGQLLRIKLSNEDLTHSEIAQVLSTLTLKFMHVVSARLGVGIY